MASWGDGSWGTLPWGSGAGGATSGWRSAELYGAGGSQSICFDPLGTRVIIGGDDNGPKTSLDGGATWGSGFAGLDDGQSANNLQTVSVAWSLDSANPNRVWMGCKGGFFVSADAGFSWQNIPSFPGNFTQGTTDARPRVTGRCIVDAGDGNVYMVDNPGRVYRYVGFPANGIGNSSTWTRVASLGETGTSIAVNPTDSRVLYVTTREGGLYQIEDVKSGVVDGATVRHFTGTNSPTNAEEVRAVVENGNVFLYVATSNHIRSVQEGSIGTGGQITRTFSIIDPPAGTNWCAIDAVRNSTGTQTLVVVGCSTPSVVSNGLSEIYFTVNGSSVSPTWQLLTGDDAVNDFINQMGGPSGNPWWGYGLRAGSAATEMDPGRWVRNTSGNGSVESVAIDPVSKTKIIAVGQSGAWMFDTSAGRSYPSMVGLMSTNNLKVRIDPTDDLNIMVANVDDLSLSTGTGGANGDWRTNRTGTPILTNPSKPTFFDVDVSNGRWWAGFGEDTANTNGEVYFNDNPRAGNSWTSMGLAAVTGGLRPMGIAVRRVGSVDIVLAAVQNGGIYKATFSAATPPAISGSWTQVSSIAFATMGTRARTRAFDIYWTTDALAFALDPTSGIWRTTDAGATWTLIWSVVCDNDRQGFICSPPDEPTTIYASFGSATTTAGAAGVWKLANTSSGTL